MNWEAIGTIAEMVGAVGVVVSLIYLAMQIRHNSRQKNSQALQVAIHTYLNNYDHATSTPLLRDISFGDYFVVHN